MTYPKPGHGKIGERPKRKHDKNGKAILLAGGKEGIILKLCKLCLKEKFMLCKMGLAILKQNIPVIGSSEQRALLSSNIVSSRVNDIKSEIADACLTLPNADAGHFLPETPLVPSLEHQNSRRTAYFLLS